MWYRRTMRHALALLAGCVPDPLPEDPPEVDDRVDAGEVRTCADPTARDEAPYDRVILGEDWPRTGSLTEGGRGLGVADLDGDGHLDLFVPQFETPSLFLFGDGTGRFEDRSRIAHPDGIRDVFGSSGADVDGDGDTDLFVYRAHNPAVILRNRGDGTFDGEPHPEWDVTVSGCGGSGSWGDMDLDGDLDLFYGRLGKYLAPDYRSCPSLLLENDGHGGFVDVSERIPADVQHLRIMASAWVDVDDDPWPELHVVADLPEVLHGDLLVDNDGATLTAMSGTGLEVRLAGMGLAWGDLNDDGVPDFVVPGIDELAVLVSSAAPGRWVDWSATWGLVPDRADDQSVGWGGELADLDADGLLDLVMGYGEISYSPVRNQPDELYRNTGAGFLRVGAAWGFDDRFATRGMSVADLNEDGWPDIAKREIGGVVALSLSRCGDAHWLDVSLSREDQPNHAAVGARIEVDAGGRTLRRWVTAGSSSYDSSGPATVSFGLGDSAEVDAIRVAWPTGEQTHHPGTAADRPVTITFGADPPELEPRSLKR